MIKKKNLHFNLEAFFFVPREILVFVSPPFPLPFLPCSELTAAFHRFFCFVVPHLKNDCVYLLPLLLFCFCFFLNIIFTSFAFLSLNDNACKRAAESIIQP